MYQDNKNTILLLENGKSSLSKRAIYLNKGYFIFTDQFEKGNLTIKYCPTESMTANFITLDKGKPTLEYYYSQQLILFLFFFSFGLASEVPKLTNYGVV